MNNSETAKILSIIFSEYPHFFTKLKENDIPAKIKLWEKLFADDDYNIVGQALKSYLITDNTGYPPTAGQLKEEVRKLTTVPQMSETEAWNAVMKAAEDGYYNSYGEFEKLPDTIKNVLGSHKTLTDYALMSTKELDTVVQSNFIKAYRAEIERQTTLEKLPKEMRNMGIYAGYKGIKETSADAIKQIQARYAEKLEKGEF